MAEAADVKLFSLEDKLKFMKLDRTKYAIVCPVYSAWGIERDQDDQENRRDVLEQAAELEESLKKSKFVLLDHPDRKEGEPPKYWDKENLWKIADMLHEKNPHGATVYMYADGYKEKFAMRDGDSDNYKALELSDWIKQFGKYDFMKMHNGVGCPIEISLDINQIPAERITEKLEDKSEQGIMCKGPWRAVPEGTFTIVSEGGDRSKKRSFHGIAKKVYGHKKFNTEVMAYWGDIRKRKGGGRWIDNIDTQYEYKGGMFHIPEDLGPSILLPGATRKHMTYALQQVLNEDKTVSKDLNNDWRSIGAFGEAADWKVIKDEGEDGKMMYAVAYHHTLETGYTGFVLDTTCKKKHEEFLSNLVAKDAQLSEEARAATTMSALKAAV